MLMIIAENCTNFLTDTGDSVHRFFGSACICIFSTVSTCYLINANVSVPHLTSVLWGGLHEEECAVAEFLKESRGLSCYAILQQKQ